MRSWFALGLLCLYFPVPFLLLWIYALERLWRRIGILSYLLHGPFYALFVYLIISRRDHLLAASLPLHPLLEVLGGLLLLLAFVLALLTHWKLDPATTFMVRQLTPSLERHLVTDGIYRIVRHPRYLMFMLLGLGDFLVTGYTMLLASAALAMVLLALAARIEERELVRTFGDSYREYASRTPRFLPRLREISMMLGKR